MLDINLSTHSEKKIQIPFKREIIIVLICVLFLGGSLWGIDIYKKIVIKKTEGLNKEYNLVLGEIKKGDNKNVFDFQSRIDTAKFLANRENYAIKNIIIINGALVSDVKIQSFNFDHKSNSISLTCIGDSYNSVSRQIASFKNTEKFSEVLIGKTISLDNRKITFDLTLMYN